MPSTISNKSQERASFAYSCISDSITGANGPNLNKDQLKELKSHIKNIPMMIRTNGLGAAFAFVFSKAKRGQGPEKEKKDYMAIEDFTCRWISEKQEILSLNGKKFHAALIANETTPEQYRLCTREIVALYTWLKRYADGMIKD